MREFVRKMKMQDNRGMSLIELIVAITILGIVATPLLRGFLISANTEVKARKMGEITNVAQSVMEIVESNTFDDIVVSEIKTEDYLLFEPQGSSGARVDEKYYAPSAEGYSDVGSEDRPNTDDYHIGLKKYEYAGEEYDVMIDISSTAYATSINREELSVNSKIDKVFQVPKGDLSNNRIIIMDVSYTSEEKDEIEFKVRYGNQNPYPWGSQIWNETELDSYTYRIPEDDEEEELAAIYLLYYPSYGIEMRPFGGVNYIGKNDKIIINNLEDIEFDLYLMKQYDSAIQENWLRVLENDYSDCDIEQHLTALYNRGYNKIGANIFTNARENLVSGNTISSQRVTYKITSEDYPMISRNWSDTHITVFKTETETKTRIYEVTVKVYESKINSFNEEALGSLTGSILK